jgi:hypothetical protein
VQDVFAVDFFVIVERDPLRPTAAFAVGDAPSGRRRRMVAAAA